MENNASNNLSLTEDSKLNLVEKMPKNQKLPRRHWYSGKGNFQPKPLADYLGNELNVITIRDTGEMYVYWEGKYYSQAKTHVEKVINWVIGDSVKKHHRREVIDALRTENYVERQELNQPEHLLNLPNGLLDLKTKNLREHDSNYFFTRQSPVKYNSDAECPRFREFINDVVRDEDEEVIQEMFGYALMNEQRYQKAFMLVGSGSNGKSTLLNILEYIIGEENVSNVTLQNLQQSRFATSQLFEKKANIAPDIPDSALKQTGLFKSLTGRDTITAEKKHKPSFEFENKATLIFAANTVPESFDDTDAFYRRWKIIKFPYKFTDNPNDGHKQKETGIESEIIEDEEELSGILNWALEGLYRLKRNGSFSDNQSTEEIRQQYKKMSNSVYAFCEEWLFQGDSSRKDPDYVLKDEAYERYKQFCDERDLDCRPKNTFCKRVKKQMNPFDYRPKVKGRQQSAWKGIKMNGEDTDEFPSW